MNQVPKYYRRFIPQLIHMIVLPLFFFAFILVYQPFDLITFFGSSWFGVHVTVLTCIILACVIVTRLLYYFLPLRLNYALYIAWCFAEGIFISFFASLYLWLIKESPGSYFEVLSRTLEFILFTLAVPYSILALSIKIYDLQNQKTESVNAARMRFYDVNRNLKLLVTADSILYIAAEENYINIYYTDNGKVKCYVLRNSMRSVDELCLSNGLVRCHRSFYVNPSHVRVLRKEKEGIVSAELDMDDLRDIPVSKTYYKNLAEML